MPKIFAVFGATGQQGGSVVRALLQSSPDYRIRAITRDPNSEKAKQLAALKNVSVLQANLDQPSTLDKVVKDCYGIFLVTETLYTSPDNEIQQGINLIDSAIRNKATHLVFSGLDPVKPVIGKTCKTFDNKAAIEQYGLAREKVITFTSVRMPGYYQTFTRYLFLNPKTNQYMLRIPMVDAFIYCMDVDDLGGCVASVFGGPLDKYKSKWIGLAADRLKISEVVEILSKQLTPNKFVYDNVSLKEFASFGFPAAKDIAVMYEYLQTGKIVRDIECTKKLNKNILVFSKWVEKNKKQLIQQLNKA